MRKPLAILCMAVAIVLALPALPFLFLAVLIYPHKSHSNNPWFWW